MALVPYPAPSVGLLHCEREAVTFYGDHRSAKNKTSPEFPMLPPEPWAWVLVAPGSRWFVTLFFSLNQRLPVVLAEVPAAFGMFQEARQLAFRVTGMGGESMRSRESLALWSFVFKSVKWTVRLDGLSRPMHLWILCLNTSHLLGMGPGKDLSVCLVREG